MSVGVRSMSAPLRRVLLRAPALTGDFAGADWREPDPALLARQHAAFAQLLASLGCAVTVAPALEGLVDACYVRDAGMVTARGGILFQMAKGVRATEPLSLGKALTEAPVLSPVDDDLAVVYPPLAPVALMQALAERGVSIVEVAPEEYGSLGCNVLAVAPRVVVMADGNPRTRAALEKQGCEVHEYEASEISVKGDGGPTCLTQPLWRS
jgi:N-dimethylarginine dimethylaminohydrolase